MSVLSVKRRSPEEPPSSPPPRRRIGHLIQNAVALMLSSAGTAILGVAFWALAAHLTTPFYVGRASAEIAGMVLLANLSQLSFGQIFERYLPISGSRSRQFVTRAYGLCVTVAALAASIYLIAGIGRRFIPVPIGWRLLFFFAVVLWTIFILQDSVLTGIRATKWVPVENILFALSKLALLPLLATVGAGQRIFLAWSIPVIPATGIVTWYLFRHRIPLHQRASASVDKLPTMKEIMSFAFAQYASGLLGLFSVPLISLIVIEKLGAVANARYAVPALISSGLALFLWNITTSFLVEASTEPNRIRTHARQTFRAAIIVLVPGIAIGATFAPLILRIFGATYAEHGTTLLRMLLLALPSTAVTAFYTAFAWIDKRIWWLAVRDVISLTIFVTVMLLCIPHFGILAVGIGSLTTSGAQAIFFLPPLIRRYRATADVAVT
jgi:O-antigen/teichoic acid export membrane protein